VVEFVFNYYFKGTRINVKQGIKKLSWIQLRKNAQKIGIPM